MSDYTQIWLDLGLDLKAHDALVLDMGMAHHAIGHTPEELVTEAPYAVAQMGEKSSKVVVGGITTQ